MFGENPALQPEPLFRLVVESAPNAIVVVTQDGRIVLVNAQTEKLFGYPRDELLGQPVELLIPQRFRSGHAAFRSGFFTDARARPMGAGRDLYALRKDGSEFPVEIGLNPIETGSGVFTLSAIVDITERKHLEAELHSRVEQLAFADRQKNEFLAMLGHELRNPLAPMRNAVHVLRMASGDARSVQRAREMLERQLQHLVHLVDDLLDVSRIVSGRIELRRARINLLEAITRGIETAQPTLDSHGHRLRVTLPEGPLCTTADLVRLAQVVANLLTNAAKYTPRPDTIRITLTQESDQAVLRVTDPGIGIEPEFLPRVFELFVQADATLARSQGGLGIGLTLVRRIVEMHGGTVAAASDGPGQGSEFTVRLPLTRIPAAEKEPPVAPRVTDALRKRVLVIDDNVDAAESIAMVLGIDGYIVECAYDGQSGIAAAERLRPDAVLLDIGLPDMDGYEVAKILRSRPEFARTRLIAVTGYGQERDRQRAREAGIDQHLTKPVEPQTLQALID